MSRLGLFARSFFLQSGFSDERRQALGFAWALDPELRSAYREEKALAAARHRHLSCFNTQPCASPLILGTIAALEYRAAAGDAAATQRAAAMKSALCGSLAGAFDALFWGALRPLSAATAVAVGALLMRLHVSDALLVGPLAGLVAFNAPSFILRWKGARMGLAEAERAALSAAELPVQSWLKLARVAAVAAVVAAALAVFSLPLLPHRGLAAAAFAAGALLGPLAGGALRLTAAAGALGALASSAGWRP